MNKTRWFDWNEVPKALERLMANQKSRVTIQEIRAELGRRKVFTPFGAAPSHEHIRQILKKLPEGRRLTERNAKRQRDAD